MIENLHEHQDLGVTFDSKLTFATHYQRILTKSNRICALSYKFAKELHSPQLNLEIIQTYLMPIIEYLSILWYPIKKNKIYQLEKCSRFATRTALGAPYRNDDVKYLSYDQRLLALEMIFVEETFITSTVILTNRYYGLMDRYWLYHWTSRHSLEIQTHLLLTGGKFHQVQHVLWWKLPIFIRAKPTLSMNPIPRSKLN